MIIIVSTANTTQGLLTHGPPPIHCLLGPLTPLSRRYYYGQAQNPQSTPQQTSSQTSAPAAAVPQSSPPAPTPAPTPSQPSYTPPSATIPQASYTSAPVSYAAAVLKGQSAFPTPAAAAATTQPSRKPNPSRFASAPPVTSAPPPPSAAPSSSSHYSATPSPQTSVPAKSTPAPNNNSSALSPWPSTLKTFVEKSFAQCETDADRSFIEDKLKSLISKVTNDGRMHKHRWELEPIPIPPSQQPTPILTSVSASDGQKDEVREPRRKKSRFQPIDEPSSQELPSSGNRIVPAKVTSKEELSRQNRANRFMREHSLQQQQQPQKQPQKQHQGKKRKAQNVVNSQSPSVAASSGGSSGFSDADLESFVVIGTCQKVEKDYFRLTSAPDPSTVRPLEVLEKALALVKEKWSQFQRADVNVAEKTDNSNETAGNGNGSGSGTTYIWLCSQLKSIRQDVMVQHIKNGTNPSSFATNLLSSPTDFRVHSQCLRIAWQDCIAM